MAPYKKPNSLYNHALKVFSEVIATKCVELHAMCKKHHQDMDMITQPLHDNLYTTIPHALYNDIYEAVLSRFEGVKKCDARILYRVVVNDKLTRLKVRELPPVTSDWIEIVVPRLKNLVTLVVDGDLDTNDDLVFAVSHSCPKLERISLAFGPTSSEAFRSMINSCVKLRIVDCGGYDQSDDMIRLALTGLPDLEHWDWEDCENMGHLLESLEQRTPLNLRSLKELNATPANVRASVGLCPHLRKLELQPTDLSGSSEMLGILAGSDLKLTSITLKEFDLCNANAERFFQAKGEHIDHLCFDVCLICDLYNLVNFIRISCKNLRKFVITFDLMSLVNSSFKFQTPDTKKASFLRLEELEWTNYLFVIDGYNGDDIEAISKIMATASTIQKVALNNNNWENGYLDDVAIEEMFPVENMRKLQRLYFRCLKMTKRMAQHFLLNGPNLTKFTVPCGSSTEAELYIRETFERFQEQNIEFDLL